MSRWIIEQNRHFFLSSFVKTFLRKKNELSFSKNSNMKKTIKFVDWFLFFRFVIIHVFFSSHFFTFFYFFSFFFCFILFISSFLFALNDFQLTQSRVQNQHFFKLIKNISNKIFFIVVVRDTKRKIDEIFSCNDNDVFFDDNENAIDENVDAKKKMKIAINDKIKFKTNVKI